MFFARTPAERGPQVGGPLTFVAPRGDDLDSFAAQLDAALADLDEQDRRLVSQSISYLGFAFGKGVAEDGGIAPGASSTWPSSWTR